MKASALISSVAVLLAAQAPSLAAGSELISDLADTIRPSESDETLALETKAQAFWQTVLGAADGMKMAEHLELYDATEKVIADLPPENEYARATLKEVLGHMRRADEMVLAQAVQSSDLAAEKLLAPAGEAGSFSFFGGQNFLTLALRRFVAGGSRYPERLVEHVGQRQADILPVLRGVAGSSGSVLTETRLASKQSFDVLKYDIYNKGVPKTPQSAKDIAYKLVDAAGDTRHRFMQFITQTVDSIAKDATGKHDSAAAFAARQRHSAVAASFAAATEQVINL